MSFLERARVDEHGDTVLQDEVIVMQCRMPLGEPASRLAVLGEGYLPPEHGAGRGGVGKQMREEPGSTGKQ